jgi:hypothetical protein
VNGPSEPEDAADGRGFVLFSISDPRESVSIRGYESFAG